MRRLLLIGLAACCLIATRGDVAAQEKFPSKPVKIITAFAPGSATDIMARLLAEQLRHELGQNVIVENKPGAFGIVAIEEMARARPDGHTLMLGNISTTVITPLLYRKKFSINPETDVTVVSRVGILYNFWTITAKAPPKTFAEFVAWAKERPGKVFYATNGVGSFPHYDSEILARRLGIKMEHISVKGGPPDYIKDMVTGDIHVAFTNSATATPFVRGGQLRALATNAPQRLAEFPDVPTMAELGYGAFAGTPLWSAVLAPAATPREVLVTINAAIQRALAADALKANFKKQTAIPSPSGSLEDTQAWLKAEFAHWTKIIDEVKLEIPE